MRQKEIREKPCKRGSHEFCHTIDPRYLKCIKCELVKIVAISK